MALALDCISDFHFIFKNEEMGIIVTRMPSTHITGTERQKKLLPATVCSFPRDLRNKSHKTLLDWDLLQWTVLEKKSKSLGSSQYTTTRPSLHLQDCKTIKHCFPVDKLNVLEKDTKKNMFKKSSENRILFQ